MAASLLSKEKNKMKGFLELAKDRYSVRKFDGREIPQEDIEKIIEAGVCAPTAVNFQPLKIWVFKSEEAREKLLSCTKMKFMEPAKVIFAIGSKPEQAWVRKYDDKNFADIDASIAATQMMLEIHDLGYGSTWIGHFDVNKVWELFPELRDYELIALLPVSGIAEGCAPSEKHAETKSREELVQEL